MRQTKRLLTLFTFYDRSGIEEFLERQALRGWLLDKISSLGWRFRRTQARRLHFSVAYFPQASSFDPGPSEKQLMFRDFCEHAGWRLAAANAQMQIFYNEADEPVPIETDALVELENIHKSVKRSYLPTYYILLFNGLLQSAMWIWRFARDPVDILTNNFDIFSGLLWLLLIVTTLGEIIGYHLWRRRARRLAEETGEFLSTKGRSNMQVFAIVYMLCALALMLFSFGGSLTYIFVLAIIGGILGIGALVMGVSALMKRRRVDTATNRGVTITLTLILSFAFAFGGVFIILSFWDSIPRREPAGTYEFGGRIYEIYRDELPLRVEDLLETDYDGYSTEHEIRESLLLGSFRAWQRPRMGELGEPRLYYSVLQVKLPALYGWCAEISLRDLAHNLGLADGDQSWESAVRVDASPWGADEAYMLYLNGEPTDRFLLLYDGLIVELDPDWELTDAQKAIVGEKLGGA